MLFILRKSGAIALIRSAEMAIQRPNRSGKSPLFLLKGRQSLTGNNHALHV